MNRLITRWWPRSLQGQLLLTIALALLLAQAIGAVLLYQAQGERREALLIHTAALRVYAALREEAGLPHRMDRRQFNADPLEAPHGMRPETMATSPLRAGELRLGHAESELAAMLAEQGLPLHQVQVFQRDVAADGLAIRRIEHRRRVLGDRAPQDSSKLVIAAVQRQEGGNWVAVRVLVPRTSGWPLAGVIFQTLLIYALLVGAIAFILRRITRPLKALTNRTEQFAANRDLAGQLTPEGPDDVRRLMAAHNRLEDRIGALLDEKDVMLGAIGHDLKTPLTVLRVRIESVADEGERTKMAATIEDIDRSLDDILSLARVGRPSDAAEPVELGALVAALAEEYEDQGKPVSLAPGERIVLPLRPTWLRRALRNLIDNALRYGQAARVSVVREGAVAVIRIEDDGPGIDGTEITRMFEPFTRGDPSRNSGTGGAGLGLTLARAIAEQHGGSLELANRLGPEGAVTGLIASLRLPLPLPLTQQPA